MSAAKVIRRSSNTQVLILVMLALRVVIQESTDAIPHKLNRAPSVTVSCRLLPPSRGMPNHLSSSL